MKKIVWIPLAAIALFFFVAYCYFKIVNAFGSTLDVKFVAFWDIDFGLVALITVCLIGIVVGSILKGR